MTFKVEKRIDNGKKVKRLNLDQLSNTVKINNKQIDMLALNYGAVSTHYNLQ